MRQPEAARSDESFGEEMEKLDGGKGGQGISID
jgi:hypothetical protein